MCQSRLFPAGRWLFLLLPFVWPTAAHAGDDFDWQRSQIWARALQVPFAPDAGVPSPGGYARANRIRLFRIAPGFPSDPVGIDADDPAANDSAAVTAGGPDWVQVSMGGDNPFFDFRRPGDPGGPGFYKVHSQVQLFDTGSTGCAFGLQAVTPAGLEQDGVKDGPTVMRPSLSVFHELENGTAFQCFLGKNVDVRQALNGPVHHSTQYGVAVQHPVLETGPDKLGSVYLFMEALGRYRYDSGATGKPAVWEMVPGVHWRMADNVWLTGGVLLPVGPAPARDPRLWQLTCSFQF